MRPDALTLPGSIHGLLRRGSPVRYVSTRDNEACVRRGVVHELAEGRAVVTGLGALIGSRSLSDLELDLEDATGRVHAAWWLAAQAKHWPSEPHFLDASWMFWSGTLSGPCWGIGPHHYWPASHDTLRVLDPMDSRMLEDGSRWVDAEALRRVCLWQVGHAA